MTERVCLGSVWVQIGINYLILAGALPEFLAETKTWMAPFTGKFHLPSFKLYK